MKELKLKAFMPLALILCLMLLAYLSGAHHYLSFAVFKQEYQTIRAFIETHSFAAPLIFIGIYTALTSLPFPGGLFVSFLGGFLFNQPWATLYFLIGSTCGATILFLAARSAFRELPRKQDGKLLKKMEKGFQKNATNYLLFLRCVPIFPFFLVNLVPAFFNIPLRTFVWTTFVGLIPCVFAFSQAGAGLSVLLESTDAFTMGSLFNTKTNIALVCLGIATLIPIFIKKWSEKS